jgi:predicted PurR-regulated permease PerM
MAGRLRASPVWSWVMNRWAGSSIPVRAAHDLPILLVFAGVIGGLIAFGVIGLFIGPVALAVAYTLLVDWVSESPPSAEQEQAPSAISAVNE